MKGVVFVHGVRRKGDVYQGYSPKTGCPTDEQGRMILVHHYGPPRTDRAVVEEAAPAPRKSIRGVKVEQERLL